MREAVYKIVIDPDELIKDRTMRMARRFVVMKMGLHDQRGRALVTAGAARIPPAGYT